MGSDLTTLGEYIKVQGGYAFKSKDFNDDEKIRVIKIKNVRFGTIDYSDCAFVSDEIALAASSWTTNEGDILISMTGSGPNAPQSLVGRVARVWKDEPESLINQRVGRIQLKNESRIHSDFIFYLLSLPQSQDFLVANSSGSANQANISGKIIELLPCPKITYEESAKIAKIIRSLDEKVIVNQQTNQTLEQMAQALFKSWFVDFDPVIDNALAVGNAIPDELQHRALLRQKQYKKTIAQHSNTKLKSLPDDIQQLFPSEFEHCGDPTIGIAGWIPKGWKIKNIDDLNSINPESWTKKNAPDAVTYVDLANAKNGMILEAVNYSFKDAPSRARRVLQKHDIIIGVVRPANRSFAYVNENGLTGSTGFVVVRALKENYRVFTYLSLTNDDCITEFARIADGAAYPAIKPEDVAKATCLYSSDEVLSRFENLVGQLLLKKAANEQELKSLASLRDILLPKLISGELKLNSAESAI